MAELYAVINRSKAGGIGTRINLKPKHKILMALANSNIPPPGENGAIPLKLISNGQWMQIQKELMTKFEIKTVQLFNGAKDPFLLIAHEDIQKDIDQFREMSKIAREDRIKKAKQEKIRDVFDQKTTKLIGQCLKNELNYNSLMQENAELSDLLKLSPNQLRKTKGIGKKVMENLVNLLKTKELIAENTII